MLTWDGCGSGIERFQATVVLHQALALAVHCPEASPRYLLNVDWAK